MTSINNNLHQKLTKKRKGGKYQDDFAVVKKMHPNDFISSKDSDMLNGNEPSICETKNDSDLFFFDISGNKSNLYLDRPASEIILNRTDYQVSNESELNDCFTVFKKVKKRNLKYSNPSTNNKTKKVRHDDNYKINSNFVSINDFNIKKTKTNINAEVNIDITDNNNYDVKKLPYKKNKEGRSIHSNIGQIENCAITENNLKKLYKNKISGFKDKESSCEENQKVNTETSSDKIEIENLTDNVSKKLHNIIENFNERSISERGSNTSFSHQTNFEVSYSLNKKHKKKKTKSANKDPFNRSNKSLLDKIKVKSKKQKQGINYENKRAILDDNIDEGISSLSDSSASNRNNESKVNDYVPNHKESGKRTSLKQTSIENYIDRQQTEREYDNLINSAPLKKSKKKIHNDDSVPIEVNSYFIKEKKKKIKTAKEDEHHVIDLSSSDYSTQDDKGYDIKKLNRLKTKKKEENDHKHKDTLDFKNSEYDKTGITNKSKTLNHPDVDVSGILNESVDTISNESILHQADHQVSSRSDKKHKKKKKRLKMLADFNPIDIGCSPKACLNHTSFEKMIIKNKKHVRDIIDAEPKGTKNNKNHIILDTKFDEGIMSLSDSSKRNNQENITDCVPIGKENSKKGISKNSLLANSSMKVIHENKSVEVHMKKIKKSGHLKKDPEYTIEDEHHNVFSKKNGVPDERTTSGYDDMINIDNTIVYQKKSKTKHRSNNGKLNVMERIVPENLIVSSDSSEIISPIDKYLKSDKSKCINKIEGSVDAYEEIIDDTTSPTNSLKKKKRKLLKREQKLEKISFISPKELGDMEEEMLDVKSSAKPRKNKITLKDIPLEKVLDTTSPTDSLKKSNRKLLKREQKLEKISSISPKELGDMEEEMLDVKSSAKPRKNKITLEDIPLEKDVTDELMELSSKIEKEDKENIEKLRETDIQLPFPVALLHSTLTRCSVGPTKPQLEQIKLSNIEVKTGPFSKEEDEMIIKNWKKFCKEYGLKRNPLLIIPFPRKLGTLKKTNILRYLGHGLDNRMLHRIHARFKTIMQKRYIKTGRFTAEEDKIILDYVAKTSSKCPFRDLSGMINRNGLSIEKRYDVLTRMNKDIIMWSPYMVDKFVTCMKKVTKCEKVKQLKHVELTMKLWKKISRKMGNIPVKKLQLAWKGTIYPKLFSKEIDIPHLKRKIVCILCERKETDWRTVNWKEITSSFKGLTPEKIYMIFKKIVLYHVPKDKQMDLKVCLKYLRKRTVKYKYKHVPKNLENFYKEMGIS